MMNLSEITVELVTDYFDREYANDLLSRHHPLGARKAIGKRVCYVAKYQERIVAVLIFDQAVNRNKLREKQIGWSAELVSKRLKHVANNTRYLLLPECSGEKNVASKILSLVTERISKDWMKHYGMPLLALETYVDPEHNKNQGTCYTAAGWENLGYSSGYQALGAERTHSKWYFLKALHTESYKVLSSPFEHTLLSGVKSVSGKSNNTFAFNWDEVKLKSLRAHLSKLQDPRSGHGKVYEFSGFLTLCQVAVLCGYTQYRQIADWIRKLPGDLRVRFGIRSRRTPTECTVAKFLSRIAPEPLEKLLNEWLAKNYKQALKPKQDVVSMDGKTLRATSSVRGEQVDFLNIYANKTGVAIGQLPTNKGAGEKATAREALKTIPQLEGQIILADAIHTDEELLKALSKKNVRMSSLSKVIKNL
jgi:hypothetical protein